MFSMFCFVIFCYVSSCIFLLLLLFSFLLLFLCLVLLFCMFCRAFFFSFCFSFCFVLFRPHFSLSSSWCLSSDQRFKTFEGSGPGLKDLHDLFTVYCRIVMGKNIMAILNKEFFIVFTPKYFITAPFLQMGGDDVVLMV